MAEELALCKKGACKKKIAVFTNDCFGGLNRPNRNSFIERDVGRKTALFLSQ